MERDPYREMTVAHIREPAGENYVEVVFLESARFYKLLRENPAFGSFLRALRDGLARGRQLRIRCASGEGDIIEEVQEITSEKRGGR